MSELEQLRQEAEQLKASRARERESEREGESESERESVLSQGLADYEKEELKKVSKVKLKEEQTLVGHQGRITALQFPQYREAAGAKSMVSVGQDGRLIVWAPFTPHKLHDIHLRSKWAMTCAISPSGDYVASGGLDNICTVNSLRSGLPVLSRELVGHTNYVTCCRFLDDNQILTSSGDKSCCLWDIETGKTITTFRGEKGHTDNVLSLSLSPDGKTFVTGSSDATAKLWDIRDGTCQRTFKGHDSEITAVSFYPNGRAFVSGSEDTTCRLFDLRADRTLMLYSDEKLISHVTSVAFSKSGHVLLVCMNLICILWGTLSGERVGVLDGHDEKVSCVGVSPDGNFVATGSFDTSLKIWSGLQPDSDEPAKNCQLC